MLAVPQEATRVLYYLGEEIGVAANAVVYLVQTGAEAFLFGKFGGLRHAGQRELMP